MAKYHGDLMHEVGNVYKPTDDRNYPVAIILAFFLGIIGIHRFYLNDAKLASFYFFPFAICMFMCVAMLDFTLLLWFWAIASIFVLLEIVYFLYRWLDR